MSSWSDRRARAAAVHDQALDRHVRASPVFALIVRGVVSSSKRCWPSSSGVGSSAAETARTLMWIGDARFDLFQGGHGPIEPAIAAYRRAGPYVEVAEDPRHRRSDGPRAPGAIRATRSARRPTDIPA